MSYLQQITWSSMEHRTQYFGENTINAHALILWSFRCAAVT